MQYAIVYHLLINGKVITDPNSVKELNNVRQPVMDGQTLEDAIAKANSYKGMFIGTISIFTQQWFDKKPSDNSGEWKPSSRGKGGFQYIYNLAEVQL